MRTKEQIEAEIAALQAELAKLDVDPLLIEAREICANLTDRGQSKNAFRKGTWDDWWSVKVALAALHRGVELAAAPLFPRDAGMSEEEIAELAQALTEKHAIGSDDFLAQSKEFARLAIRETLKRAPLVRWPGDAELRRMADAIREDMWADRLKHGNSSFADAALEMARRLKAHLTGEVK